MKIKLVLGALSCLGFLVNCGGGGGGGNSSSSHGVRVLHASIDDAPLSVVSSTSPTEVMQTVRFAQRSDYVSVSEGIQSISVEGGQVAKFSSREFEISGDESRSVLFFRNAHTDEPTLVVLADERPELEGGQSAIRIVHAVKGAAVLAGDINGSSINVSYSEGAPYLIVPSGLQRIDIRREADGKLLSSQSFDLAAGKSYTLLMSGEVDYLVVATLLDG